MTPNKRATLLTAFVAVIGAGCVSQSPWPTADRVCAAHGGPHEARELANGRVRFTCADGVQVEVVDG
jgi:hypothetical protein